MFLYRITGPQSVDRLTPLLPLLDSNVTWLVRNDLHELQQDSTNTVLSFVWETYVERSFKPFHDSAIILNRLHNTVILEDKGNLAFLQLKMKCPVLTTHIALNSAAVLQWARNRWGDTDSRSVFSFDSTAISTDNSDENDDDWWVVKASRGNGGKDIWIMHRFNYLEVILHQGMPTKEELVIQKYVHNPLLINGKKFHYRCYTMIRGDMSGHIYQHGYILTAGIDYHDHGNNDTTNTDTNTNTTTTTTANSSSRISNSNNYNSNANGVQLDMCKHISNLSVNKHIPGHPGQIPCHLAIERPEHYTQIKNIWSEVVAAAAPFLRYQSSSNHFEFYGIDVIVDSGAAGAATSNTGATGTCWLIEINRLPGLESSAQNRAEEDLFYNTMMFQVLRMVTRPLLLPQEQLQVEEYSNWDEVSTAHTTTTAPVSTTSGTAPTAATKSTANTWKNIFQWKAFTRKRRAEVVLAAAAVAVSSLAAADAPPASPAPPAV